VIYEEWGREHGAAFPETPWLAPEAIEFLGTLLRPNGRVLEYGAGGSTIWLARRVTWVTSLEHSPSWLEATERALVERGLRHKAAVKQVPAGDDPDFEARVRASFNGRRWDLAFVDGQALGRAAMVRISAEALRPGGWLVVDNVGAKGDDLDYYNRLYRLTEVLPRLAAWRRTDVVARIEGKLNTTSFWRKPWFV
jgi:predicted O-methyltransferase YrrM